MDEVNSTSEGGVSLSNEQLLDDALKEALNEVQLNNPQLNERSILNDKEMMQEIEDIFDRGNAQLIEGLDEIRREQVRSIFVCIDEIDPCDCDFVNTHTIFE